MSYTVPEHNIEDFHTRGFTVLSEVIPPDQLDLLRFDCDFFVKQTDKSMEANNIEVEGLTHRAKRYFIRNRYRGSKTLWRFLYSPLMHQISTAFIGDDVFLFLEQWVVKGPHQGMEFAWHQDSGYLNYFDPTNTHDPYITCWSALDDVSAANGTISLLPHDVANTKNRFIQHTHEPGQNDLVAYHGDEPGVTIEAPAGSIVVIASTTLHSSSSNTTDEWRRAYLAQYSPTPILRSDGELLFSAVPFVKDGEFVYDVEYDLKQPDPW